MWCCCFTVNHCFSNCFTSWSNLVSISPIVEVNGCAGAVGLEAGADAVVVEADASSLAAGAAVAPPVVKFKISSFVIRPPLPVAHTKLISIPFSRAN